MQLKFTTTGKKVELANFLLSEAIEAAKTNKKFRSINDISLKDLEQTESFRKQMLSGYFRIFKSK